MPNRESFFNGGHQFRLRVYYEDTDAGGIVYYANYLKFAERARTEMLRCLGIEQTSLRAETGALFVVKRCDIDYKKPAILDDLLCVETRIRALSGAKLSLTQEFYRENATDTLMPSSRPILAMLSCMLACININGRVMAIPDQVILAFRAMNP